MKHNKQRSRSNSYSIFTIVSLVLVAMIIPQAFADSQMKSWREFANQNFSYRERDSHPQHRNFSKKSYPAPERRFRQEKPGKESSGNWKRYVENYRTTQPDRNRNFRHGHSRDDHAWRNNKEGSQRYTPANPKYDWRQKDHKSNWEAKRESTHRSEERFNHGPKSHHRDDNGHTHARNERHGPDERRYKHGGNKHKHVSVSRHYKPRIDYGLYKRHRYVYYRTPWYNTRYLAPIRIHYHKAGYRINRLPGSSVRVVVRNVPYFYYSGVFYRPYSSGYIVVSAPIGAFVTTLPVGFIGFSLGISTYYYANDTYYVWDEPQQAYQVVEKPDGADGAIDEATSERLFIYPNSGQDEEQQAKDRYECHRWAVKASNVDPTMEDEAYSAQEHDNYQRAISACLSARNYTVK